MDGLIPFIFKVLRKKKAMKYYRSLSSGPANIDELTRQDLFMTPQHHKASGWHEGDDRQHLSATMTPPRGRTKSGNARRHAIMQALPRETFSPHKQNAARTMVDGGLGSGNLGGK